MMSTTSQQNGKLYCVERAEEVSVGSFVTGGYPTPDTQGDTWPQAASSGDEMVQSRLEWRLQPGQWTHPASASGVFGLLMCDLGGINPRFSARLHLSEWNVDHGGGSPAGPSSKPDVGEK